MGYVTTEKDNKLLILDQFNELKEKYTGLNLSEDFPGRWAIRGVLDFKIIHEITIEDSFDLLIKIPRDYPDSPPSVQETGGRIPKTYHTLYDGTLCLESPVNVKLVFFRKPTLLNFVDKLVVPYFYNFLYLQKYGKLPAGEFSHGPMGILESYLELLKVSEIPQVFGLLKILADNSYRGHIICPCGSGKKLRDCHGTTLRELANIQSSEEVSLYVLYILKGLSEVQKKGLHRELLPKVFFRQKKVLEKR